MRSNSDSLRLIILTQYYPPEIGAPQARLSELAAGLVEKGFIVTVLTAMPNYPKGKIYQGYGGLVKFEKIAGVKVIRTAIYPTQSTALIPRLLNYFSFVLSSIILGVWLIRRSDYILTESPPLFLGFSGYILSRVKGARWIFNVSDLWPESAVLLGAVHEGFFLKLAYWLEGFCYKKAWVVSGQSKSILSSIKARFPKVNVYHLSNGVDPRKFSPMESSSSVWLKKDNENQLCLLYAGLHGIAQGLEQIINAAAQLKSENVKFYLVGDGPEKKKLVQLSAEMGLSNVVFLDPIEKKAMPALLAEADVSIVPLKLFLPGAVPSKLYEAMSLEKPVILIAEGEAAEIVEQAQAGIVVKPGDIAGIVSAIKVMFNNPETRRIMGISGRKTILAQYDRKQIIEDFGGWLSIG